MFELFINITKTICRELNVSYEIRSLPIYQVETHNAINGYWNEIFQNLDSSLSNTIIAPALMSTDLYESEILFSPAVIEVSNKII